MDKIWLSSYEEGVPEEIDVDEFHSLNDVFRQAIEKHGPKIAYVNFGKTISFDELDEMTRNFAAYITKEAGLTKGDRIAIMMPNLLQYPIVIFGALRAGLVIVNTNPLYTKRELEHQLKDSGAKAIVIIENFANTLEGVINNTEVKTVITTRIGDCLSFPKSLLVNFVVKYIKKMVPAFSLPNAITFNDALAKGVQLDFSDVINQHGDTAFLQYTGGTTGVAKGAMLTHRNMIANLQQASIWAGSDFVEGEEVFVTALPLYHIFSLTANAMFALKIGAKTLLITNPRDLPTFIKQLQSEKFTFLTGVNTLFNALLNTPGFKDLDFSTLKLTLGGGMAVTQAVAKEWKEATGHTLVEAYGLTETSPAAVINPINIAEFNGMIGLPISSTEISIRDKDLNEVALGERGELWIRGPQVMKGYWNRPKETANVFDDDGFLRTGDVAVVNEQGFVKIVDRLKDMILVSGFNVYPNEVEDVISTNPKILEVGAIGIPHETSGEVVKIYVVKKDSSLTKEEVYECCKESLTGYKRPKEIEFIDELPKSNVGKILRRELRELHESNNNGGGN